MKTADYWIEKLGLHAHPEGGYFRETYRADEKITTEGLPDRFLGDRSFSTAIYFLLTENNFSSFHRIQSDELWFFHAGSELKVQMITPNGNDRCLTIGPDGPFQTVVPAQCWFGAEVKKDYALVSCTVAPGFDFTDFELADRQTLLTQYPQHRDLIVRLTH
jgi:predicted cupin superfamily sugar epimerase